MDSQEHELFIVRQPIPLIGREDAIASIKEKLLREDVGLLTLIGVAGVGKTRLALEVLNEIRPMFSQVVFVDLSPVNSSAQVLPTIARSCGVLAGAADQLSRRLSQAIGARNEQLVLGLGNNYWIVVSGAGYYYHRKKKEYQVKIIWWKVR